MPLRFLAILSLLLAAALSSASLHPANIPVARVKIKPDGSVDLKVRFDLLAFVLEQDPMVVLDPPMNALLDGPQSELDTRLAEAKNRFLLGVEAVGGTVEGITFPTAAEVHKQLANQPPPRLPVMTEVVVEVRLPPVVERVSFRFPEVLGTVVLTTERPYSEPITEPVEPGARSQPIKIPTPAEIAQLAAAARPRNAGTSGTEVKMPSQEEVKAAIQKRYDEWSKAYMAHDVDKLLAILSPGYTLKTTKGAVITLPEYKTMLNVRKQKHDDTTKYSTEIQRITLHDGVAAIYARETTTSQKVNKDTGKTEDTSYQHDYIDVWELRDGKWFLKSTVTVKEQTLPPG